MRDRVYYLRVQLVSINCKQQLSVPIIYYWGIQNYLRQYNIKYCGLQLALTNLSTPKTQAQLNLNLSCTGIFLLRSFTEVHHSSTFKSVSHSIFSSAAFYILCENVALFGAITAYP